MPVEIGNEKPHLDGAQWERVRKQVDGPFVAVHAELKEAYYEGRPFREEGVLDKARFDQYHALIWHKHTVAMDDGNTALSAQDTYPDLTATMNDAPVDKDGKATGDPCPREFAEAEIARLSAEGIDLEIA